MTKKFNNNDVVSIEAKVLYAYTDGSLDLDIPLLGRTYIDDANTKTAKLVKKAPLPQPAAGSVIDYFGSKYIVTANGDLTYIDRYNGSTEAKQGKWADLMDQASAKILA